MTLPDWIPDNYLLDFEPQSYTGFIVKAPLVFKAIWINKYLHEDIFPDAINAVVNGSELSGLLLGFSIVDYLAGYFSGKCSQAKDVIRFMNKYFPKQYKPYSKIIYNHLRSGLVHNLALQNPWVGINPPFILEKQSELHLQIKDNMVVFSIYHFIEDTRRAEIMYIYDIIMKPNENQDMITNFQKRFNKQEGAASMMMKTD